MIIIYYLDLEIAVINIIHTMQKRLNVTSIPKCFYAKFTFGKFWYLLELKIHLILTLTLVLLVFVIICGHSKSTRRQNLLI